MGSFQLRVAAFVACLLSGAVAQAVPVIYDFAGSGYVCTYASSGACSTTYTGAFTGTVSIDVLASGPSGADGYTGASYAYDNNGWVQSDFLIQWGSNSFNPGAIPSQTYSDQYAWVANDYGYDQLYNREYYYRYDSTGSHFSYAELNRGTYDTSWLSDLSFPVTGLAPASGWNYIRFYDYGYDSSTGYSGFNGYFSLSSLTARTTSVPEPGALALFGFGLAGLGFARRRRTTN